MEPPGGPRRAQEARGNGITLGLCSMGLQGLLGCPGLLWTEKVIWNCEGAASSSAPLAFPPYPLMLPYPTHDGHGQAIAPGQPKADQTGREGGLGPLSTI